MIEDLRGKTFEIEDITRKRTQRNPYPPFITSTLQQDAARRLRFTTQKTMMIAQQLYEGIELGDEGAIGLITYMRTDSTRIVDDAIAAVRDLIGRVYGDEYVPPQASEVQDQAGRSGRPRGDPPHGGGPQPGEDEALPDEGPVQACMN